MKTQILNLSMFLAIFLAGSAWMLNPHACCPIEPVINQLTQCVECSGLDCPGVNPAEAYPTLDKDASTVQVPAKVNTVQSKDSLIGGPDSGTGISSPNPDFQILTPFFVAGPDTGADLYSVTVVPLKRPPRIV